WGHPLDTLTALVPFALMAHAAPGPAASVAILALMLFSCGFVTKDEWVHARLCGGEEGWLHAVLFMLHPTIFVLAWIVWRTGGPQPLFSLVTAALALFCGYQVIYWNLIEPARAAPRPSVDNTI